MKKFLKIAGVVLLVGVAILGALYLIDSTGLASSLDPGSLFGQLIGGFADALDGLQASISRMFSNFAK